MYVGNIRFSTCQFKKTALHNKTSFNLECVISSTMRSLSKKHKHSPEGDVNQRGCAWPRSYWLHTKFWHDWIKQKNKKKLLLGKMSLTLVHGRGNWGWHIQYRETVRAKYLCQPGSFTVKRWGWRVHLGLVLNAACCGLQVLASFFFVGVCAMDVEQSCI